MEKTFVNWDVFVKAQMGEKKAMSYIISILRGKYEAFTSNLILNKVVEELMKKRKVEEAAYVITVLCGPTIGPRARPILTDKIRVYPAEFGRIEEAKNWFLNHYEKINLNLADWTSISIMQKKGIQKILTFDKTFDQLSNLKDETKDATIPTIVRIGALEKRGKLGRVIPLVAGLLIIFLMAIMAKLNGLPQNAYYPFSVVAALCILAAVFGRQIVDKFHF